jgi:hypothetical protein
MKIQVHRRTPKTLPQRHSHCQTHKVSHTTLLLHGFASRFASCFAFTSAQREAHLYLKTARLDFPSSQFL